jgi:hypothetical protein
MGALLNLSGNAISHCCIEEKLGGVDMGIVYRTRNTVLCRRVIFRGGWSIFTRDGSGSLLKTQTLAVERVLQFSDCGGVEPRIPLGD